MSIEDSKKSSTCPMRSKYFTDKPAMDESLTDFQEIKKSCTGPKNLTQPKSSKHKKALRRVRGQKDIRIALKSQKNELESYSKDFDKVCKKAGIDVDSEQLQLAVALSKSLQETASTSVEVSESTQLANTQDRIGKIRTTLQEYGFKVPEVKIAVNTRRVWKRRKDYKLIATSDNEKKEIIADKYSQILFQSISLYNLYNCEVNYSATRLYYLTSNVSYDILKLTDTFYTNKLIEKSTTTGNMLRDWSEIPGRPLSPQLFESTDMNFSEIECSQEELDIVLSGSLKSCKSLLKNKIKGLLRNKPCKVVVGAENEYKLKNNVEVIDTNNHKNTLKGTTIVGENYVETVSILKQHRSCSPDIFDDNEDDASCIFGDSRNSKEQKEKISQLIHNKVRKTSITGTDFSEFDQNKIVKKHKSFCENLKTCSVSKLLSNSNVTRANADDFMELTECIQNQPNNNTVSEVDPISQLSQKSLRSNNTKRISNDFMEITECVSTLLQPILIDNNIDLTQNRDIKENTVKKGACKTVTHIDNVENINKSEKAYHLSHLEAPSKDNVDASTDNGIDLTDSPENYNIVNSYNDETKNNFENPGQSIESMDLTQSSNSSEELPFVSLTVAKDNSLDNTIIVDYAVNNNRTTGLQVQEEFHIDLTQYSESINKHSHSESFFEEYFHNHSGSSEELKEKDSDSLGNKQSDPDKIDLTQSLDNSSTLNKNNYLLNTNCIQKEDKRSKHSKVDLTQDTERQVRPYSNSQRIGQEKTRNTNISCSHAQYGSGNLDLTQTPTTSKYNYLYDIEEPLCINDYSSNSNNKQSKPDKVNLTLIPVKKPDDDETSDIDLTQNSDDSVELNNITPSHQSVNSPNNVSIKDIDKNVSTKENEITIRNSQRCSLRKEDDVSIDYDDYINTNKQTYSKTTSSQSIIAEIAEENTDKHSKNSFKSNCSQNSEPFEISDKELDYSLHKSKLEIMQDNFAFAGIYIMDELSYLGSSKKSIDIDNISVPNNLNDVDTLPAVNVVNKKPTTSKEISPIKHKRITEIVTPKKAGTNNMVTVVTPQNSELIIKTSNVTPMLDYESMSMPEIHKELDNYGIKPFKRKRAIQLLTHIYNQTHPIIETYGQDLASPPKRHKPNEDQTSISPRKRISQREMHRSPRKDLEVNTEKGNHISMIPPEMNRDKGDSNKNDPNINQNKENVRNKRNYKAKVKDSLENHKKSVKKRKTVNNDAETMQSESTGTVSEVITEVPVIKEIACKPEDWVFQKRDKAKVHSCRVPLHIAFHNYVSSRTDLREAILCYEPVEIDVIHKDLVAYGHRYDPKDLLKFLDKNCITVKTTDNDARNHKR